MTTDAELRIQLMVAGGPQVRRELARVSADAERSGQRDTRSTRRGATEVQRAEQTKRTARGRTATEHRTNTDKAEGHERKAIRDVLRDFERAERSKRAEMARTRGASRDGGGGSRSSGGGGRGRGVGGVGGSSVGTGDGGGLSEILGPFGGLSGIVAAVSAAVSVYNARVQRSTQILGLQNNDEILTRYQELDLRLTNALMDAGATPEQAARVRDQALTQTRERGIDPAEVIALLETAQGQFDKLIVFADNLETFGLAAVATGSDIGAVGTTMGVAQRQFGLTADQFAGSLGVMSQQAEEGSIGMRDFAGAFAPVMGTFAGAGRQGESAMREFGAFAQVMGTLDVKSADEAATIMDRTLSAAVNPERQARFREIGIELANEDGTLRDTGAIMRDMARSQAFNTPQGFAAAVGEDVNAQRGFRALRDTQRRDPEMFERLRSADANAGLERLRQREAELSTRESQQARVLNGRRVATLVAQAEPLVGEHVERARDMSDFTAANPRMEEAIPDVALPIVARIYQTQQRNQQSNASAGFVGLGPQRAAFKDIAKTGGGVSGVGPAAPVAAAAGSERAAQATERLTTEQTRAREATVASTAATRELVTALQNVGRNPPVDTGGETGL